MFIRSYVEIPGPFAEIENELLRRPAKWLPTVAAEAESWGVHLLGRVGFGPPNGGVYRSVQIELGRPIRSPGKMVLPIRWHAARAQRLFPVMEADLELTALGPDMNQLALNGRYDPPLGAAGKLADRAFMHRVAEATVRRFVKGVAEPLSRIAHPAAMS
jgi:hypothetical protein